MRACELRHACESRRDADVRRLRPLRAVRDVEADLLTFLQALEAIALDRREMREEILAAVGGSDEAEALRIVEPLDGTCCHVLISLLNDKGGDAPGWGEDQDGG